MIIIDPNPGTRIVLFMLYRIILHVMRGLLFHMKYGV